MELYNLIFISQALKTTALARGCVCKDNCIHFEVAWIFS